MNLPKTNQVANRVKTNKLWISELQPNDRGVLRLAHIVDVDETLILFEIQNDDGIEFYESKKPFPYSSAYKHVARGLYGLCMMKGITKSKRKDW